MAYLYFSIVVSQAACTPSSPAASAEGPFDLIIVFLYFFMITKHRFIANNRSLFEGHQVLELGAGCGLAGLVASRFATATIVTDGNDLVLEMLNQNTSKQYQAGLTSGRPIESKKLLWGSKESLEEALDGRGEGGEGSSKWQPQILLGADVVCWPDYVAPLLSTIKALFIEAPDPPTACMYLGFVNR